MSENLEPSSSRTAYVNKQHELVIIRHVSASNLNQYTFETGLDTCQFWITSRSAYSFYLLRSNATISLLIELKFNDQSSQAEAVRSNYQLLAVRDDVSYYLQENLASGVEYMTQDGLDHRIIILKNNGNVYRLSHDLKSSPTETLLIDGATDSVKYLVPQCAVTDNHIYKFAGDYYGKNSISELGDDFKMFDYWSCRLGDQFALLSEDESVNVSTQYRLVYPGLDARSITRFDIFNHYLDSEGNLYHDGFASNLGDQHLTLYRTAVVDIGNCNQDMKNSPGWNSLIDYIDSNGLVHRAGRIKRYTKPVAEIESPGIFITDNALFLEGSHLREFQSNWMKKRAP